VADADAIICTVATVSMLEVYYVAEV